MLLSIFSFLCISYLLKSRVDVVDGFRCSSVGFVTKHKKASQLILPVVREGQHYDELRQQGKSDSIVVQVKDTCSSSKRRIFLNWAAASVHSSVFLATCAQADDENDNNERSILRQGKGYGYKFQQPSNFRLTRKPILTHFDELNLEPSPSREEQSSLLFGITVDHVRINSLAEFGTPEQVAARIVTAELNRDGIFEVTLDQASSYKDSSGRLYYIVNYISDGKRGKKRFLTRTCIADQNLYVTTAQMKDIEYRDNPFIQEEIEEALNSFTVVGPPQNSDLSFER